MRFSTPQGHDMLHDHGLFLEHQVLDAAGLRRGRLAGLGAVFLVLGVAGFGWLSLMTVASVLCFGALAFLGGVVQLVQSFAWHGSRNFTAGLLLGVIYLCAGILMVSNPYVSSFLTTALLALALVALGVVRLGLSFRHQECRYWGWSALSGALSVLLGIMTLLQWPVGGVFLIGFFISLELVLHGTAALALAFEPAERHP